MSLSNSQYCDPVNQFNPTMWNPFKRNKVPYHEMISNKELSESENHNGEGSSLISPLHHKDEHDIFETQAPYRMRPSHLSSRLCNLLIAVISLLLGLLAGQFLRLEYEVDGYLPPYAAPHLNIPTTWTMNTSFTTPPSAANSALWSALMPLGRGFISHPTLTSNTTKAVSAFHQIHCLHGLRTAYFAQTNRLNIAQHRLNASRVYTPNAYLDGMSEHELGLHHVEHCFEYVRQAIMCAADTNLEDTKVTEKGDTETVPWGGGRVCRDWEGVRRWAEKWSVGDGVGIVGK